MEIVNYKIKVNKFRNKVYSSLFKQNKNYSNDIFMEIQNKVVIDLNQNLTNRVDSVLDQSIEKYFNQIKSKMSQASVTIVGLNIKSSSYRRMYGKNNKV